jgi:hypothetical protein
MYASLVSNTDDNSISGTLALLGSVANFPIDAYSPTIPYLTSAHTYCTTTSLPAGLTLNSSTGVLSGTPTSNQGSGSTFTIADTFHDDFNNVSSQHSCTYSYTVETAGASSTLTPVGAMSSLRPNAVAVALSAASNAKVLVLGGVLQTAELFDPSTGLFQTTTGSMTRYGAQTATLLSNGKVLIAGGFHSDGTTPELRLELYDPTTQTFSLTGTSIASSPNQAIALQTGNVLFLEGTDTCDVSAGTTTQHRPQLYNSTTNAVTSQTSSDLGGTAGVLLGNGKVLIRGYQFCAHNLVLGNWYNAWDIAATLYDPATAATTATGNSSLYNGSSAPPIRGGLLLASGDVFFSDYGGGQNGDDTYIQIYHVGAGTWTQEWSLYSDFDQGISLLEPTSGTVLLVDPLYRRVNSYNVATKTMTSASHYSIYGHGAGSALTVVNKGGTLTPFLVGGATMKNGEYYNP